MMNRTRSLALMMLAAASFAGVARAADLPEAKTILEKNLEATGGRAAMEKVKSRVTTIQMDIAAAGISGKLMMYQQGENALMEADLAGVGTTKAGMSGGVVWESSPMTGTRVVDGPEKAQQMRSFAIASELHPEKYFKDMKTVGEDEVNGRKVYKVQLTPNEGSPESRFYDQENYQLLKVESTVQSQMGEMTTVSLFSDFRKEGDFTMPHTVTQTVSNMEIVNKLIEVKDNVEIDPSKFELPEDVKKLMAGNGPTTKPM
jgi:hypothetical protein